MKKLIYLIPLVLLIVSCNKDSEQRGYKNSVRFELFQSSDFEYTGFLEVFELNDGKVRMDIQLTGANSPSLDFPAHLHFGAYDAPVAEIAAMLNPINGSDLKSSTILPTLADGEVLSFEDFQSFDGHIKIHLAAEGPDYEVILVSGNIGSNYTAGLGFDMDKITTCSPK
ncbi:hypothetical protein ACFOSV_12395 [Algoriphagus namhaensis]|uniref:CHRD domain-containing protein n=1 Tax=Algoriphagus namhaensis TaxID=915353 RepID=A0ABV8ATM7_9BACT